MSWEDQGRQEHGWFGHGTAPPKDSAGGSGAEAQDPDADPQADAAADKAHAWAKISGPVLFGLPRSGPELEAFAEAVSRIERSRPGSIARALDSQAAQGVFGARAKAVRDGLLTLVQEGPEGSGEPTRMPGGSFRDLTPREQFRVTSFGLLRARLRQLEPGNRELDSLSDPDAVPSEEVIARLRAEVEAAEARARLGQPPERLGVPSPERGGAAEQEPTVPGREALHFHDWDRAAPTPRDGVLGGAPTGIPADEMRGNAETQRGLRRENEAAKALAAAGYRVEQNLSRQPTDTNDPATSPDLRVGDNIFDVYSPKTSNLDTIRNTVSKKVKQQADRLVINLVDSTMTPDQVRDVLAHKPVSGLQEVLVL